MAVSHVPVLKVGALSSPQRYPEGRNFELEPVGSLVRFTSVRTMDAIIRHEHSS